MRLASAVDQEKQKIHCIRATVAMLQYINIAMELKACQLVGVVQLVQLVIYIPHV